MVEAWWQHDGATALSTEADVDAMIDAMVAAGVDYSVASLTFPTRPNLPSGFPDHELRIAVLDNVGGVQYGGIVENESGQWYVPGDTSDQAPLEYFYMGNDEEWPADSIVPLDVVRAMVKEFLSGGGDRPTSPEWAAWL